MQQMVLLQLRKQSLYCVAFKGLDSKNQDFSQADKVVTDFKEIYIDKL